MVRASSSLSNGFSPFHLLTLSLSSSPPLSIDVETLCWKLSRRYRVACLPYSSQILIVYQLSQSHSVAGVVRELTDAFPASNVVDKEEVGISSSIVTRAIECGLRCAMLENGWSCVGENSFVCSSFDASEEGKHVCAVNVNIQPETDDDYIFIVSPDVIRFSRHKVSSLVGSKLLQKFNDGEEVILEEYNFSTSCTTLPSLHEGYVMGLSKQQPLAENFERFADYCTNKHGLSLASDFFIFVWLTCGGSNGQWLPSTFVLQGSGLAPTPQRIRSSMAIMALESFMNILGAWNFFDQGFLRLSLKESSSLAVGNMLPIWQKATSNIKNDMAENGDILNDQENLIKLARDMFLALDFHTPKPPMGSAPGSMALEFTELYEKATTSSTNVQGNTTKCVHGGIPNPPTGSMSLGMLPKFIERHKKAATLNTKVGNTINCVHCDNPKPSLGSTSLNIALEFTETHIKAITSSNKVLGNTIKCAQIVMPKPPSESASLSMGLEFAEMHNKTTTSSTKVLGSAIKCVHGGTSILSTTLDTPVLGKGFKSDPSAHHMSALVNKSNIDKGKHTSEVHMKDQNQLEAPEGAVIWRAEKLLQPNTEASRKFKKAKDFYDSNCPLGAERVLDKMTASKRILDNDEKNKENISEVSKKMKGKQPSEQSDISYKVLNCYKKGELHSLTVAEMKCFLASKKMKVGGKKEELIQRINLLLN
ncbi:uncharacterized protein LOC120264005 isoform X3 [Dioscorea cayenensis subsp. rotundata]|nr:uncharacterized protein LOC120264005 isoform X3 [Dioscorea cayenensis subsp. rotundata]